jgi:hypothetical protein
MRITRSLAGDVRVACVRNWCRLRGHDWTLQIAPTHLQLRCVTCGAQSAGLAMPRSAATSLDPNVARGFTRFNGGKP